MAQNEQLGPFSQYLVPQQQEQPKYSGYESNAAGMINLASRFLEGIKETRLRNIAQKEMEQEQNRKKFETAANIISSREDLTPDAKNRLLAPIYQQIVGEASSVREGNQHTGHGLTDTFKGIFKGMVGGEAPKSQKYEMATLGHLFTDAETPENKIAYHKEAADKAVAQFINNLKSAGTPVSLEDLSVNPDFMAIVSNASRSMGKQYQPILTGIPETKSEALLNKAKEQYGKSRLAEFPSPAAPATSDEAASPTTSSIETPTAPPPLVADQSNLQLPAFSAMSGAPPASPKTTTPPTSTDTLSHHIANASRIDAANAEAKAYGYPPIAEKAPLIEKQDEDFLDPSATKGSRLFRGVRVTLPNGSTKIYNMDTQLPVHGARKATTEEKQEISPEKFAELSDFAKKRIADMFGGEYSGHAARFSGMIDYLEKSGDKSKVDDVLKDATAHLERLEKQKQAEALTRATRASGVDAKHASLMQKIYTEADNSNEYKDRETAQSHVQGVLSELARIEALPKDKRDYSLLDKLAIRALAKLTDITTGVRDSEYTTFAEALGRVRSAAKGFSNLLSLKGETFDPPARKMIINELLGLDKNFSEKYNNYHKDIRKRAASEGLDPEKLYLRDTEPLTFKGYSAEPKDTPPARNPSAGASPVPLGQTASPGVIAGPQSRPSGQTAVPELLARPQSAPPAPKPKTATIR